MRFRKITLYETPVLNTVAQKISKGRYGVDTIRHVGTIERGMLRQGETPDIGEGDTFSFIRDYPEIVKRIN